MKRTYLLAATYTSWATVGVGLLGWKMANIFSPHTGKFFLLAVALTAICCALAENEKKSKIAGIERQIDALTLRIEREEYDGCMRTASLLREKKRGLCMEIGFINCGH